MANTDKGAFYKKKKKKKTWENKDRRCSGYVVTFCAFSTIREVTTAEKRLREQLTLCETSLQEGKLVCELEIIYRFVHVV